MTHHITLFIYFLSQGFFVFFKLTVMLSFSFIVHLQLSPPPSFSQSHSKSERHKGQLSDGEPPQEALRCLSLSFSKTVTKNGAYLEQTTESKINGADYISEHFYSLEEQFVERPKNIFFSSEKIKIGSTGDFLNLFLQVRMKLSILIHLSKHFTQLFQNTKSVIKKCFLEHQKLFYISTKGGHNPFLLP